ncbi:MAG: hypothetical protein H0X16_09155 [Chloroflexi bacterium]|nr:hypothetical protein [Chloroflexota bacterium]
MIDLGPEGLTGDNCDVTLNLDTSTAIRSLARYRELVTAIFEAPASTQETLWVEWKSTADIAEKRWAAELSRQVLGMANRDPEVTGTWCGGCAYVVIGVSPASIVGTPVHDTAKIESWLTPYVGRAPNAPEWAPTYVEVQGQQVLVITIEPPQFGHPAWPCQKTYSPDPRSGKDPMIAVRDGAVYVRHKASTEEANSADVAMLSRRAAGSRRRIGGISVLLAPSSKAQPVDATEDAMGRWAEAERVALKPAPPKPPAKTVPIDPSSSLAATAKLLAELSQQSLNQGFREPDSRPPEKYQAEVDTYIEKATKAMPAVIVRRAYERKLGRVDLSIRNNTDDPIDKLQLEVFIGAEGVFAASEDVDVPETRLPGRPIMLGKAGRSKLAGFDGLSAIRMPNYASYLSPAVRAMGRGVTIDNSGSTRLTFDALDLYPQEVLELDEFYLYVNAGLHTGKTLSAGWTARARNLSGVMRGTLEIAVDTKVPTIDELLAETEGEDEED